MTYRERREARAERLREWAAKRKAKAGAVFEANRPFTEDHAFNTQPGHIPARARVIAQEDRALESLRKTDNMSARAATIEAQAAHAIYSDDADGIERLRDRIAGLEAERDRIKAFNASCRKGTPDESLLDERQRAGLESVRRHAAYSLGKNGAMPGYALTNLGGNINKQRKRLEQLERAAASEGES